MLPRVIHTIHKNSRYICAAFAEGLEDQSTQVHTYWREKEGDCDEDIVIYGLLRGLLKVWQKTRENGKNWIYIDNGYFKKGHYHGYYSVTYNSFQHPGTGAYSRGEKRLAQLGLEIEPWKRKGREILILPPTFGFATLVGFKSEQWIRDTKKILGNVTERPVRVRYKPGRDRGGKPDYYKVRHPRTGQRVRMPIPEQGPPPPPLREDLEHVHAVVTYNSKAAMEAALLGYPVFVNTPCSAYGVGSTDLSSIDNPQYPPDRERWLANLAANQWNIEEMRSGQCYEEIMDDLRNKRTIPPHPNARVTKSFMLPLEERITHRV